MPRRRPTHAPRSASACAVVKTSCALETSSRPAMILFLARSMNTFEDAILSATGRTWACALAFFKASCNLCAWGRNLRQQPSPPPIWSHVPSRWKALPLVADHAELPKLDLQLENLDDPCLRPDDPLRRASSEGFSNCARSVPIRFQALANCACAASHSCTTVVAHDITCTANKNLPLEPKWLEPKSNVEP